MGKSYYDLYLEVPGTRLTLVEENGISYEHLIKIINNYQEEGYTKVCVYTNFTKKDKDEIFSYFRNNKRDIRLVSGEFVENVDGKDIHYTVLKY